MLENKIIVLTGACGKVGMGFREVIAGSGGTVVMTDIDEEAGQRIRHEMAQMYHPAHIDFVAMDITSKGSIGRVIEYAANKYGKIDALVNSAYPRNKNYGRDFKDVTYEDFCENVNTHLGGFFLTSQQFAIYFKGQGVGNIINMASVYGVIAPRFELYDGTDMSNPVEYAVIKSALIHLTRYMAKYLKGTNVRVNAISPGGLLAGQPQHFLDRYNDYCMSKGMLSQKDINGTLLFLLSDMSEFINGQNIVVDDGFCL